MSIDREALAALYPRIEPKLPAIMADFYDRLFDDFMIGFFFAGHDKQQLIERQVQFTAKAMGGPDRYQGRPIAQAHAAMGIFDGQFDRRHHLLRQVLTAHGIPDEDRELWLALDQSLRARVVQPEPCKD